MTGWLTSCAAQIFVAMSIWLIASPLLAYEGLAGATSDPAISLLRQHCFRCHNADKQRGDLDLSTFTGALMGGGGGSALVPGQPEKSPLFLRAKEGSMPPETDGRRLSESELKTLADWIAAGAMWQGAEGIPPENASSAPERSQLSPKAQQNAPAESPVDHSRPELRQRPPNQISAPIWRSKLACRAFRQRGPLGRSR